MELAERLYLLTRTFPRQELFGLTSQIRRAAASIPANIAEGWGRQGTAEFQQFLRIASGSLRELETHLLLAQRVSLCKPEQAAPLLDMIATVSRQILTLQRRLREKRQNP
jgi:four helix bundle protein